MQLAEEPLRHMDRQIDRKECVRAWNIRRKHRQTGKSSGTIRRRKRCRMMVVWLGSVDKVLYCIVLCCVVFYCIYCICICIVLYCIVLYCIVSKHLYSASCSAHQSEALPVRGTRREKRAVLREQNQALEVRGH